MNRRMLVDTSMLFVFLLLLDYRCVHNFGHERTCYHHRSKNSRAFPGS